MSTLRPTAMAAAAIAMWGAAQAATGAAPELARVLERHRVDAAPAPVRDSPRWRAPRKVVLLQFEADRWAGRVEGFRTAAPGVEVVVATTRAEAIAAVADADAIIGFNPDICSAAIIDGAKQLRWLASLAAGVDLCMNVPAVKRGDFLVTNMRGMDSPAIAEHAVALMLAVAHGLDRFMLDTANGVWSRENAARIPRQSLEGKTLLVAGLGGIGTEIARRAAGLGMRIVATRQGGGAVPDFVDHVGQPEELLTLAERADVVVNALPLTAETTGLFDRRFFNTLRPSAIFVNIARGPSVVTEALVEALESGRLAGAGLDVTDPEPLPPGHPLWKAPRVIITPHISARSDQPGDARWIVAHENLRRYVAGEPMLQVVDVARGY